MPAVTLKDHRKNEIVYLFKRGANATRVTLVMEYLDCFTAHCQSYDKTNKGYASLGFFKLLKEDYDCNKYTNITLLRKLGE